MSWIATIDERNSFGKLKNFYEEIIEKRGKLSNIMRIHSLNPEAMKKHMELYLTLMFGSSKLKREKRELIAVVVSSVNNCDYCVNHHAEALNNYWKNKEKIRLLLRDFRAADIPEKDKRMLNYVVKLTKNPSMVDEEDVESLKKTGFSDRDILDINLITSYFNFVNRIALGLGVRYSEDEMRGYNY